MLRNDCCKMILDAFFHTGGGDGPTPQEELDTLIKNGTVVKCYVDPDNPDEYFYGQDQDKYYETFEKNLYEEDKDAIKALDNKRSDAAKCTWWVIKSLPEKEFPYTKPEWVGNKLEEVEYTIKYAGWKIERVYEKKQYYPSNTFLALFTQMPDESGNNYIEPDETTTYMRVNLHSSIITGGECLGSASKDEEDGKSVIRNIGMIYFPEIEGVDWGNIVGFGIFEKSALRTGDTPILWGRLNNENGITASVDHVPLFRSGDFQIYLQ